MYVTRPLSLYRRSPEALSLPPPEGPNSGYLVLQDEESEAYCCFGLCKRSDIKDLPFPQNKNLVVLYTTGGGTSYYEVLFIPVLNQPLSLNRYYVIKRTGRQKGEAYASSREEDMSTGCCCRCVKDVKPRPLVPQDIYQQFEVSLHEGTCIPEGSFVAKSIAPDGFPPSFLRTKGWNLSSSTPRRFTLGEAAGLDPSLRARLPGFNFPVSDPVVVGKWYCPFMFVKDGELKDQVKTSPYYEMTLEQKWEQIFACENNYSEGSKNNTVAVDVVVKGEVVAVGEGEAVRDGGNVTDGVIWFRGSGGGGASVGLRLEIMERMKWEQARGGWDGEKRREVRVQRTEEYGGIGGGWTKFGCYVLVETFLLKRMDGSLVLSYGFKHTHQINSRWE